MSLIKTIRQKLVQNSESTEVRERSSRIKRRVIAQLFRRVKGIKTRWAAYSLRRLLFRQAKKYQSLYPQMYTSSGVFHHAYLEYILSQYRKHLPYLSIDPLLNRANQVLEQPFLRITDKPEPAPGGNKQDYLSFSPYFWLNEEINPLTPTDEEPEYRDSRSNPFLQRFSDKPRFAQICSRIHILGLAFQVTNDKRYAQYASKQLNIWFCAEKTRMNPHFHFAQTMPWSGKKYGHGIIDARWLILLIDGVMMLRSSPLINSELLSKLAKWLHDFGLWIVSSDSGNNEIARMNNRGTWVDVLLCYICLVIDDESLPRFILATIFNDRVKEQITLSGEQPMELRRYNSVSYSLYNIYPILYLKTIASFIHFKNDVSELTTSRLLSKRQIQKLKESIEVHEKGSIEHIPHQLSFSLNLYYPCSFGNLDYFPAIFPFTEKPVSSADECAVFGECANSVF
jgi:hypothetical protein